DGMGISAEYLPRPGRVPIQRVLLEIPAGEHELVILYQEHGNLKDAFCFGTCAFATERLQDTVMFTAEPDRIHVPFASDKGGCNWLWVEDWGDYLPGMETVDYGELSTKLNKPVVGGSSPGDGDCKSDETLE
ncbi:MAG: hypothetical protein R3212_10110, partial [Xanthomonadales bacterium]|nr:hypothetical protein [Xanthomonadales bacterium]